MVGKTRDRADLSLEPSTVEFVKNSAEPLFPRHWRLDPANQKTGCGCPEVAGIVTPKVVGLVQMAAGDERHGVSAQQRHQPCARFRLHRPVSGIAFLGAFEKQRLVQEPDDPAALGVRRHCLKPGRLDRLLAQPAAEHQRVETDQAPALDILDPPILAKMEAPAGQAFFVYRLARMARLADIVVARDRAKPHSQFAQQTGGIGQIVFNPGAVNSDVAGMDDEIRTLRIDPSCERRPVIGEMRLSPAQMRVGDLNYAHRRSPKWAASSVIWAKTCRHRAAMSWSAWPAEQW